MCGIAGLWGEGDVSAATEILRHRGPDDAGVVSVGPVRMGNRRLKVIDLSGGHQPMTNEDGTLQLVFNGTIFNYRELRRELEGRHEFRTQCDTEV